VADIAALREATETEALESLQGRPSRQLNASELAKQWDWPRSRVRCRRATWRQSGQLPKVGSKQKSATRTPRRPAASWRPSRPAASPIIKVAVLLSRHVAVGLLGAVGIGLSAIGMIETASYALAVGGVLFCALAIAADALTLVMPATIGALWRKRSPAMALAGLLWCAGVAVTFINIAGYVGEHIEQYQTARESRATEHNVTMERLAQLRNERKAIIELRPPAAILAAMAGARRPEQPALREALAMARRRDALDLELAAFAKRLIEIPQVAIADASAAVLSEIGGTAITAVELRRFRLALLLGLPLCGGLVLSLALALSPAAVSKKPR
jgi:hypothetical protein